MKRPKNFSQAVERIREKEEAPVLQPRQLRVWASGYIDGMDDALELIEQAEAASEVKPGKKQNKES
ncbi:hypothetical protein JOC37_001852 [Desulfohalotomaculum tongense]|uniref:hypothetical protein n=1 Tax=Desulforadius tongensis TaxID=1216062 RepID=UPI001956ABCC|nr:hypothetical protein [Desulforadius tongensis]MBM7855457.1 hypothetical protein [Desulforadius tongensis]